MTSKNERGLEVNDESYGNKDGSCSQNYRKLFYLRCHCQESENVFFFKPKRSREEEDFKAKGTLQKCTKATENMFTWHQLLLELAEDGLAWCTGNGTACVSTDFHTA